ncbi:glycerol-3-phosphate dehydrogenase/oxidase [Streptomyces sp900105245]|uniref:Glycerol-3-phosphate dehydrogenase n=1 Tax=Streptomyces sp. 900105245 TaxID=3154379 RepID=A0ABV1ULF8_9ACTN
MISPLASTLSPARRTVALRRIQTTTIDVLVIGGGVVGAGAALDAASRGLSVAVVEAQDWASGTSSRPSKLVHGGLRHLVQKEFKLVREALLERGLLMRTVAPHLVKPVRVLCPAASLWERVYLGAGMTLYDVLSGRRRGVLRHKRHTKADLRRDMPGLTLNRFCGGLSYCDAQVDATRLALTLIRTAGMYGALAVSRAAVTCVEPVTRGGEPVELIRIRDEETGEEFTAWARHVVKATDVLTDGVERTIGSPIGISASMAKSVHLVVPQERIPASLGLLLRTEHSVLFVIPWADHWIIGTTDTPWTLDKATPALTSADIDYLLRRVNVVLETPLSGEDVVGVYAGLRTPVAGHAKTTTQFRRQHVIDVPRDGVAVIAGGKLITYRAMAEDVVDAVLASRGTAAAASRTSCLPLIGAAKLEEAGEACQLALRERGLGTTFGDRLVDRYGSLAADVVSLVDEDPRLGSVVRGSESVLLAEIAYAVEAEGARHLEDILVRRTGLAFELPDAGFGALEEITVVAGDRLCWSDARRSHEIDLYSTRILRERDVIAFSRNKAVTPNCE